MQIKQECPQTPRPPIKKIRLSVPPGMITKTTKATCIQLQGPQLVGEDLLVDPFNEKKPPFVEALLEDRVYSGCSQSRDPVLLRTPSPGLTGLEDRENLEPEALITGNSLSPSVRSDLSRKYGTRLANVMQNSLVPKPPQTMSLKKLQEWKELNLK